MAEALFGTDGYRGASCTNALRWLVSLLSACSVFIWFLSLTLLDCSHYSPMLGNRNRKERGRNLAQAAQRATTV